MNGLHRSSRILGQAFIKVIFYVPKGVFYTLAEMIDYVKFVRLHPNIACEYCKNQPVNYKNDWTRYFKRQFNYLQRMISPIIYYLSQLLVWVVTYLAPRTLLKACLPHLKTLWRKRRYLEENRSTIVLKYLLPLTLIFIVSFFLGFAIIPEIYIILLASSWAGKILNFCANVLVRRGKTPEWSFLKACFLVIIKRRTLERFYQDYQIALQSFVKELFLDLLIVGGVQRFSSFINYCFQAFFGWLVLYVLVKTAADEAPSMLQALEGFLNEEESSQSPNFSHQLGNGLWIMMYYTFLQTSSESAQLQYRQLHQASHAAPILLDCAETQGSNLNTSQSSLRV